MNDQRFELRQLRIPKPRMTRTKKDRSLKEDWREEWMEWFDIINVAAARVQAQAE